MSRKGKTIRLWITNPQRPRERARWFRPRALSDAFSQAKKASLRVRRRAAGEPATSLLLGHRGADLAAAREHKVPGHQKRTSSANFFTGWSSRRNSRAMKRVLWSLHPVLGRVGQHFRPLRAVRRLPALERSAVPGLLHHASRCSSTKSVIIPRCKGQVL